MKKVSSLALAATLALAGGSIALTPAAWAKKEEKEQGPALSPAVRTAYVAAKAALDKNDLAGAETNLATGEAAAKTDDEKYVLQTLRVSLESTKAKSMPGGTSPAFVAALDAALANPKLPKQTEAIYANARAQMAYNGKQYKDAIPLFERARAAGNTSSDIPLQLAQSKAESGDVAGASTEMQTAMKAEEAAGRKAPESWYKFMISRSFHANDMAGTDNWTRMWLAAYGSKENWRAAIYTFGFQGPGAKRLTDRQRVDLYRLMRASGSLAGAREWLDYAVYVNRIGLPTEAVSVVDEGRKTGVLNASDAESTTLLKTANAAVAADKSLAAQETAAKAAANGAAAAQTGDAYLGARNYAKAAEMYKLALSKSVADADAVNLHLGIAQALSGNKADAQTSFAAVKTSPNSDIAKLWTTWLITPPSA